MAANDIPNPPADFDALSKREKIAYVQKLWDNITGDASEKLPDWHLDIVEHRSRTIDREETSPWQKVKVQLKEKYEF
jgi:hypothetical protein